MELPIAMKQGSNGEPASLIYVAGDAGLWIPPGINQDSLRIVFVRRFTIAFDDPDPARIDWKQCMTIAEWKAKNATEALAGINDKTRDWVL